jgi:hypothetical protein
MIKLIDGDKVHHVPTEVFVAAMLGALDAESLEKTITAVMATIRQGVHVPTVRVSPVVVRPN